MAFPQLDQAKLAELVAARFPLEGRELSFRRIPSGKFNRSYYVDLDGQRMVLRVAPLPGTPVLFYEKDMMRQEPLVHQIVRERTDCPVAAVLATDFSRKRILSDYLFMERLPGLAASDLPVGRSMWERVLEQLGRCLRQVHEITGDRYGYVGPHRPMEPQDNWVDAFRIMWSKLVQQLVGMEAYTREQGDWLVGALEKRLRFFDPNVPASLLHMDVWSQNILLDESGKFTGLVDWDRALWGDPEIEYAVLDYCGISEPAFWRGYGRQRDTSAAARIRHHFYFLYEHQKYILIRGLRNGRWEAAMRYRDECWSLAQSWFSD